MLIATRLGLPLFLRVPEKQEHDEEIKYHKRGGEQPRYPLPLLHRESSDQMAFDTVQDSQMPNLKSKGGDPYFLRTMERNSLKAPIKFLMVGPPLQTSPRLLKPLHRAARVCPRLRRGGRTLGMRGCRWDSFGNTLPLAGRGDTPT